MKRPTTINNSPPWETAAPSQSKTPTRPTTTTLSRPTTGPAFDHLGFNQAMQEAYRGIQGGQQVVYRDGDGHYHPMLADDWRWLPVGAAVAMIAKTSRGMRISGPK